MTHSEKTALETEGSPHITVPSGAVPTDALTPADLQTCIAEHGIAARLIRNLGDTRTVQLAAAALGVTPEQIIKSLLFLVPSPTEPGDIQPILVISNGERYVDRKAIAAHFGVSPKKVKFAPADVVLAVLGYPAGGVPPFGHRTSVPVIVDASLQNLGDRHGGLIYGGGGDEGTLMELTVTELLRVTGATVLDVSTAE
jgi:prolyl-tRNA editing enzyme YbaK/EbsC (Cys-tRNA(Pro) deacylase)